jgi:hypothetical protein
MSSSDMMFIQSVLKFTNWFNRYCRKQICTPHTNTRVCLHEGLWKTCFLCNFCHFRNEKENGSQL